MYHLIKFNGYAGAKKKRSDTIASPLFFLHYALLYPVSDGTEYVRA